RGTASAKRPNTSSGVSSSRAVSPWSSPAGSASGVVSSPIRVGNRARAAGSSGRSASSRASSSRARRWSPPGKTSLRSSTRAGSAGGGARAACARAGAPPAPPPRGRVGGRARRGGVAQVGRPPAGQVAGRLGLVGPALGRPHHPEGADLRLAAPLGEQPRDLLEVQLVEPAGLAAVAVPAVGEDQQVGQVLAGQLGQQGRDLALVGVAALVEADLPVGPSGDLGCHGGCS